MEIDPDIKFDDVIGLDDAKEILRERLVDYFKFKDKLKYPPSKGLLLYGYPGTGKTMLVNAVVNELANPNIMFRIVECSELTAYVGTTEAKVNSYFEALRKKAEGRDIVLLMDEMDQIVPKKTSNIGQRAIVSERISALLKEIDGLENKNKNVFIIGTTNHPGWLEEAFVRSGRIDEHIKVDLPTDEQRRKLIKKYIEHIPNCVSTNLIESVLIGTTRWTGADYRRLGYKLDIKYQKNMSKDSTYYLSASDILIVLSEINKQRKVNFKVFEDEYKKYMNA